MITAPDFQSYAGPGDRNLARSEVSGYQPVSRIGEIVINSFVDAYEFAELKPSITHEEMHGKPAVAEERPTEFKPHFHEWATVQPGMVLLARKKKTAVFRQYIAAETAVPVIACAACLKKEAEPDFYFAGIARSQSVRTPDDGIGASVDEFFTTSIGGMATVLNTSGHPIFPGDLIEWTLAHGKTAGNRSKQAPRRIGVRQASVSSPKVIGRALSFAKSGETFDLLIRQ